MRAFGAWALTYALPEKEKECDPRRNKREMGMDRRTVVGLGLAAAAFPKYARREFAGFDLKAQASLVLA